MYMYVCLFQSSDLAFDSLGGRSLVNRRPAREPRVGFNVGT